jgi:uncharacterized membrane protein
MRKRFRKAMSDMAIGALCGLVVGAGLASLFWAWVIRAVGDMQREDGRGEIITLDEIVGGDV